MEPIAKLEGGSVNKGRRGGGSRSGSGVLIWGRGKGLGRGRREVNKLRGEVEKVVAGGRKGFGGLRTTHFAKYRWCTEG